MCLRDAVEKDAGLLVDRRMQERRSEGSLRSRDRGLELAPVDQSRAISVAVQRDDLIDREEQGHLFASSARPSFQRSITLRAREPVSSVSAFSTWARRSGTSPPLIALLEEKSSMVLRFTIR